MDFSLRGCAASADSPSMGSGYLAGSGQQTARVKKTETERGRRGETAITETRRVSVSPFHRVELLSDSPCTLERHCLLPLIAVRCKTDGRLK